VDTVQIEKVVLDTVITPELAQEGVAREIVRHIQEMRKEAGYEVDNKIKIWYNGQSEVLKLFGELIAKETLADAISEGLEEGADLAKEFMLEGEKLVISIKR
jgi:isoleucyl-tRNA synthetase